MLTMLQVNCMHALLGGNPSTGLEVCNDVSICEQARAEVYDEVICFIELLNTLLQSLTPAHVEQSAHFTHFVLADAFGQLHQRAYR